MWGGDGVEVCAEEEGECGEVYVDVSGWGGAGEGKGGVWVV